MDDSKERHVQPRGRPAQARPERSTTERVRASEDRWNERMARILREAAGVREERARARTEEDERLARKESAALLELGARSGSQERRAAGGSHTQGPGDLPS
jgi:hypothetical protein